MAGQESQEKTEDATPKRMREARKKGQVAKSRDLTTLFVMIVVFSVIAMTAKSVTKELRDLMDFVFKVVDQPDITLTDMTEAGAAAFMVLAKVLAPIFLAGFVSALVMGFIQVGPLFTTEPLTPKFEKLNPIEGFKNMFKMQTFVELLKNIVKLGLVFYIAYSTISKSLSDVLLSSHIDVVDSVTLTGEIVYSFFIKISVVFFAIALVDMGFQRWNHQKNMRMSKEEIKREYKEDEGDPHIKHERRRLHREMVFGDARKNVKKADAVVSNPIHVAVAIQYDREEMAAPEITIKGQRNFAELILEIAREENIPIVRNIPLAWSLLQLEVGDAIPEDLYEPVAEVLSFVYELKEKQNTPKTPNANTQDQTPPSQFNPLG